MFRRFGDAWKRPYRPRNTPSWSDIYLRCFAAFREPSRDAGNMSRCTQDRLLQDRMTTSELRLFFSVSRFAAPAMRVPTHWFFAYRPPSPIQRVRLFIRKGAHMQNSVAGMLAIRGWFPWDVLLFFSLAQSCRCRINKHSSRCRLCFESSDPAPLISKLTQIYPAAANKNKCLFIRPLALTCAMSVNIDIRGEGARPTLTTSRMSVYSSDTGNTS